MPILRTISNRLKSILIIFIIRPTKYTIAFYRLTRVANNPARWENESIERIREVFDDLHPELQKTLLKTAVDRTALHKLIWRTEAGDSVIERFNKISNIGVKTFYRKYVFPVGAVVLITIAMIVAGVVYQDTHNCNAVQEVSKFSAFIRMIFN